MAAETRPETSIGEPRWLLSKRWCIYIDILGFSGFWEWDRSKALTAVRALMLAIHRIGTKVYPDEPERLFVHQMGDGFAIVSDFGEVSLERPVAIAIALMRHLASTDTFAVAAIAEGDHADIKGCYPREVTDDSHNGRVRLGAGLMTLSCVMGTAFIRAYGLHSAAPSAPLLTVSGEHWHRVPEGAQIRVTSSGKGEPLCSIDWVRSDWGLLSDIQEKAGISAPSADALIGKIQDYCARYTAIRDSWGHHLRNLHDVVV